MISNTDIVLALCFPYAFKIHNNPTRWELSPFYKSENCDATFSGARAKPGFKPSWAAPESTGDLCVVYLSGDLGKGRRTEKPKQSRIFFPLSIYTYTAQMISTVKTSPNTFPLSGSSSQNAGLLI